MKHPAHCDYRRHGICYDPATMAFVALSAFSAISANSQARKEAKAQIAEGNIVARNKAKEVALKTGAQRNSFLNSGLTLDGTPMNVIESTFNTGIEDINLIRSNYDSRAKRAISAGRTQALSSLAGAFALSSFGDVSGGINNLATDVGHGFDTLVDGKGFGFGYDVSKSFRAAGGGFKPGEFA